MKKLISLTLALLMALTLISPSVNAKSIEELQKEEQIQEYIERQNIELMLKLIRDYNIQNSIEPKGSEPVGEYKTVIVRIFVSALSTPNPTYYYEDEYYKGYIPLVKQTKYRQYDGSYDWMLTYEGEVKFKK